MPLMVHPENTPVPLTDILAGLRGWDILTHCFHGMKYGILDDTENVLEEVKEAVKEGLAKSACCLRWAANLLARYLIGSAQR